MKVELNLTEQEYERFVRVLNDQKATNYAEFVMRGVDYLDSLRFAKEKVGAKNHQAILLARNPKNKTEYILLKY